MTEITTGERAFVDGARVALRPAVEEDAALLYRIYASTREEELAPLTWGEPEKRAFLEMQFRAQHQYYHQQFPRADFLVLLCDGVAAGRLYLDRRPGEICILDIALLPEHRGGGLGTFLLRRVLAEAAAAGLPVRIHVERFNPALRLYQRLGFRVLEDVGVYFLMEWRPASSEPPAAPGA